MSKAAAITPVPLDSFDPGRDCPRWLAFLDQALGDDAAAIRFFQQWAGYNLTGETREQVLLFIYGPGGSGKTTAVSVLYDLIAEYAANVAMSSRVPYIQFTVFELFDGFEACKIVVLGQLGDLGRWQVAEAPDGGEILGCLETLFRVACVTGKPGFPALNNVLPRDRGFLLRDGKGVRVQADPDALALFHALIAARHALAQVVSAAPLHDGHGRFPAGGVCGLCGEMCCKTCQNDGARAGCVDLTSCFYWVNIQNKAGFGGGDEGIRTLETVSRLHP